MSEKVRPLVGVFRRTQFGAAGEQTRAGDCLPVDRTTDEGIPLLGRVGHIVGCLDVNNTALLEQYRKTVDEAGLALLARFGQLHEAPRPQEVGNFAIGIANDIHPFVSGQSPATDERIPLEFSRHIPFEPLPSLLRESYRRTPFGPPGETT